METNLIIALVWIAWLKGCATSCAMSTNDPAGRAKRPCWFTGFVFQVARSPAMTVHRWLNLYVSIA
jgi:hypothetical protein